MENLNPENVQPQTQDPEIQEVETNPEVPAPTKPDSLEDDKQSSGIKQLRENYEAQKLEVKKTRAILERIAKREGVSIEELEGRLEEEEIKQSATQKGIPLEIEQQFVQQRKELEELRKTQVIYDFEKRRAELSKVHPADDQAITDLAKAAEKMGVNIFTPGVDLVTIYRAVNYDKIRTDLETQIRTELSKSGMSRESANPIPGIRTAPNRQSDSNVDPENFIKSALSRLSPK